MNNENKKIGIIADRYNSLNVIRKDIFKDEQEKKDYLNLKYKFYHVLNDNFWDKCDLDFNNSGNPLVINKNPTLIIGPKKQTADILDRFLMGHRECFVYEDDYDKLYSWGYDAYDGFYLHSPIWFKDNNNLYYVLLGFVAGEIGRIPFHIILKTVKYNYNLYDMDLKLLEEISNLPRVESLRFFYH